MSAPPIPSAPADLELIAQLKSKLQYAQPRILVLEERLRQLPQVETSSRDYLAAVLPGLADFPIQRLPYAIPAAWVASIH